jgi:hypothetical protein
MGAGGPLPDETENQRKATMFVAICRHDGTELAVIHGPPAEQRVPELTGDADRPISRSGS